MKAIKEWFIYIGFVMLISFSVSTCIFGCRATKDRKALTRVQGTSELLDQAGREWLKKNPCVNDTVTNVITGTPDTLTEIVEVFDTAYKVDSFETVTPVVKYRDRIIRITRTDTVKFTVEDKLTVNLLKQDTARLNGQILQLTSDRKAERKRGNTWFYAFLGLLTLNIGYGAITLYRKFK